MHGSSCITPGSLYPMFSTSVVTHLHTTVGPGQSCSLEVAFGGCAESSAAASGEAYDRLQVRQQALQTSLAHHSLHTQAHQDALHQQLHSLECDLTAVKQERDAAVTGLKALQTCDEKIRCSLHVGLSQVSSTYAQPTAHNASHNYFECLLACATGEFLSCNVACKVFTWQTCDA